MNARVPPGFQRPSFPSQMHQKSNLEQMMENMLMVQQKQDEYIKQLVSKVNVLTTCNWMLETQIVQKATFSSTPLDRLPSELELNLREQCNAMLLQGDKQLEGPKQITHDESSQDHNKHVENIEKEISSPSKEIIEMSRISLARFLRTLRPFLQSPTY